MERDPEIVPLILVKNDEYWLPYCLKSVSGWFDRYVIYDVGSTDRTKDIINWFVDREKKQADFFVRFLPHVDPMVQGAFRNSMIAEARSEFYLILDGDEIYSDSSLAGMHIAVNHMKRLYKEEEILYGVVPRVEVTGTLDTAYGTELTVPHHRIYHRTAIFEGPHPGEWPFYKQTENRQRWFDGVVCNHFHNTERSSIDAEVPKRIMRRGKRTYHPGTPRPYNIFQSLPILMNRIEDFPVNPILRTMQDDLG